MEGSMEESTKEQSSAPPVSAGKTTTKLRYPLRSATTKSKEEKPSVTELNKSSASKRGRPPSSVAKSVSVLDLSGKNRSSAKPPRRLSVPSKPTPSSNPRPVGNISPISEANKAKRLFGSQGKNGTPASDYSRSYLTTSRGKNLLSSTSYWLSHIKQSESAAKHNISLGFFKLALEAGCEPIQKMRDELKSYARRHNIVVLGEAVAATGKELFESYNISEHFEQLQMSDTSSQVPEDGRSRSSDDDVRSSSSITRGGGAREVKTRSLKALTTPTSKAAATAASLAIIPPLSNETNKKDNNPGTKMATRVSSTSYYRKATSTTNKTGSGSERGGNLDKSSSQMKKKPRRQEMEKGGAKEDNDNNATNEKKGEVDDSSPTKKVDVLLQENKENLDALQKMGEMSLTTTIQV
ncbi:uncharacterized protein LOC124915113 [Impatiens glandulifera]|uniref:uncharacterized protein LOC124915113 n=1 Tax=Impatiens glandulifera TaxID=253017 RepID=UPI001FB05D33|nr:uncharacterized protein LOC124915113 [Impatiens glandulifera]